MMMNNKEETKDNNKEVSKANNKEDNKEETKVRKIIPSKLETGFQQLLYKTIGQHIPIGMTPNQVTLIGAIGGLIGIICAFLSKINSFFLIGTICGILCHLICDDLDGYLARTRNMASKAGGYFDLLTDILHITYLIIALAFAGFVSFEAAIFLVPVYALIIFTSMNYILYLREFLFPRIGPIETHIFFVILCIGIMILGRREIINIMGWGLKFGDVIFILGEIPMYYEMIRLQIRLFKKLRIKDLEEK